MRVYTSPTPLPSVPDDLTIPQFIFDSQHELRPFRHPDIPWLIEEETGRRIGEHEIRARTKALASGLRSKFGIKEDNVVLLFSRNHVDYTIALWAAHQLGAVVAGTNPELSSGELLYQLEATRAAVMIVHPDSLSVALSAARSAGLPSDRVVLFNTKSTPVDRTSVNDLVDRGLRTPDSDFIERKLNPGEARTKLALLCFSSGTTGKPKAVAITHFAFISGVIQMAAHNKLNQDYCDFKDQRYRPGDIAIGVLPFYHIYGLVANIHFIFFAAMSVVVVPKFNFVEMLNTIVRHRISHLFLVPPQAVLLCKHPAVKKYDLRPYVRSIMCGAAPLSHELNQQLFDLLPDAHLGQIYGLTESCAVGTMWSITQKRGRSGGAGTLLPGVEARVIKSDGSIAGYDQVGELFIKTPSLALGYANNAEATKATFIDGWMRTGDEVKIDRNGELWVLDRLKEIIKVKGFQVAPAELEGCILEHKDVFATCVIGIPDDYRGEIPLAFVVLTADSAQRVKQNPLLSRRIKDSIIKYVADNKVKYKHLGGVEFIDAIPTSSSGKMLRRLLRDKVTRTPVVTQVTARL